MGVSKSLGYLAVFIILFAFIITRILLTNTTSSSSSVTDFGIEWVSRGLGSTQLLTSINGIKWEDNTVGVNKFTSVSSDSAIGVAYGKNFSNNPLWVAVGGGDHNILTSNDGINWQANASGVSKFKGDSSTGLDVAYGMCNGEPLWVAVGLGDHNILTSNDGINWQANASGVSKFGFFGGIGVAYGTSSDEEIPLWVAVGGGDHNILTSSNGINWQANASGVSKFGGIVSVGNNVAYGTCNGEPLWVAVGNGDHNILTSSNGINWQANASGVSKFGTTGGLGVAYGTCNGEPLWVAVGFGDHNILTSNNGINWQANASGISKFGENSTDGGYDIAYGTCDGTPLWVAVGGRDHNILISNNGINWQANASGVSKYSGYGNGIAAKHLLYGVDKDYYTI